MLVSKSKTWAGECIYRVCISSCGPRSASMEVLRKSHTKHVPTFTRVFNRVFYLTLKVLERVGEKCINSCMPLIDNGECLQAALESRLSIFHINLAHHFDIICFLNNYCFINWMMKFNLVISWNLHCFCFQTG